MMDKRDRVARAAARWLLALIVLASAPPAAAQQTDRSPTAGAPAAQRAVPQPNPIGPPGSPVPDLCFLDGQARQRCLSAWRGRAVLLNLWATWCQPCVAELPQLDRLQARFGGPAFEVIALSVDRRGLPVVEAFLERHRLGHLAAYVDPEVEATERLGVRGIPVSLLIDRHGRLVERLAGEVDWETPARLGAIERLAAP